MMAPIPSNEAERLRTLARYRILDTVSESAFDELTRLAATICDTPISLVSFVGENRQWFKSHYGTTTTETPRSLSFCAYAILQEDVFEVEDARADARFKDNLLVTSEPFLRFYAGVPLAVTQDLSLGSLCVIDRKPRHLTSEQKDALRVLGNAVITHLELRRALFDIRDISTFVPMCPICRRIQTADGSWMELEEYAKTAPPEGVGVCPDCAEGLQFG